MPPPPYLCHPRARGPFIDRFSYFVVFYSLILGLALTELLGGFARLVRARALGKLEPQTALVALFALVSIAATWVDGWDTLQSVSINFAGLWAPVMLAIFYYLAAAVIFPHDEADHERLADYYQERRPFVIAMLLAAQLLIHYTYSPFFIGAYEHEPAVFWLWSVPYNVANDGALVALLFVRSRRWNIALLGLATLLITVPYWAHGAMARMIARHYGYV